VYSKSSSEPTRRPISVDIDFFKQINDNYNHHVGDQALVAFASLLKKFVRSKDIVARYGGEEFVILCANCDAASARQRAEEIRIELTQTPQPMLDNKCITASFGVSELLSEDTPTDLFVRADTALLTAKEEGRNRVVCQTGTLEVDSVAVDSDKSISETGLAWSNQTKAVLESGEFQTITPVPLMVTKLRGYILEKDAELKHVDSDSISMQIEFEDPRNYGRRGRFLVDIEFQSQANRSQSAATRAVQSITYLRIAIREAATRKWFSTNCTEVAPDLMRELRDFLMIASEDDKVMVDRATDPTVKR
jgi:diguanylate cyclase (GGDEF)-like protein